jgi:hypothetical protein
MSNQNICGTFLKRGPIAGGSTTGGQCCCSSFPSGLSHTSGGPHRTLNGENSHLRRVIHWTHSTSLFSIATTDEAPHTEAGEAQVTEQDPVFIGRSDVEEGPSRTRGPNNYGATASTHRSASDAEGRTGEEGDNVI